MNLQTASRRISHYFNTWAPRKLERFFLPPPAPNLEEQITFVDIPQAREATIFLGNISPPATASDHFPFLVLNQILGGTPGSRLFMNLRESKGYAYYRLQRGRSSSRPAASSGSGPGSTSEAVVPSVREILRELGPEAVGRGHLLRDRTGQILPHRQLPPEERVALRPRLAGRPGPELRPGRRSLEQVHREHHARQRRAGPGNGPESTSEPPPVVVIVGSIQELAEHISANSTRSRFTTSRAALKWTICKGADK